MVKAAVADLEELEIPVDDPFPPEVDFVLSAMEAGPRPLVDRQRVKRTPYRVRAMLRLFSDGKDGAPVLLYTRSISPVAVGFICSRPLPLSHGGILLIPKPAGGLLQVACSILRCRQATPQWQEGAVHFNRAQNCFDAEAMEWNAQVGV
jgi:hypothetical protein